MIKFSKITITALILTAITAGISCADSIGYINIQQVYSSYEKTKAAQADIKEKELVLQKEIEKKQKEIEAAQKNNMSTENIQIMAEKFEQELDPKKKEFIDLRDKLTSDIQADIVKATKLAAKEIGIEIVMDKQVFIVGGIDLTNLVIQKLENPKK